MKKTISTILLCLASVLMLVACDDVSSTANGSTSSDDANHTTVTTGNNSGGTTNELVDVGSIMNVWCWNDDFKERLSVYPDYDKTSTDGSETTLKAGKKIR